MHTYSKYYLSALQFKTISQYSYIEFISGLNLGINMSDLKENLEKYEKIYILNGNGYREEIKSEFKNIIKELNKVRTFLIEYDNPKNVDEKPMGITLFLNFISSLENRKNIEDFLIGVYLLITKGNSTLLNIDYDFEYLFFKQQDTTIYLSENVYTLGKEENTLEISDLKLTEYKGIYAIEYTFNENNLNLDYLKQIVTKK